jgi:alkylation response protein AidB-like acyl-CoA dehydrogenase
MTGAAEFNEVYMTDARVSDADRLGDVGNGWAVALATLMNERVSIGGAARPTRVGPASEAVRMWNERGHDDPAARDRLMRVWSRGEVMRLMNTRAAQTRKAGTPGPDGSIGKLAFAELNKDTTEVAIDLMGMDGQLYATYDLLDRPGHERTASPDRDDILRRSFLRSRANSIEGGTSEVMRNILGERVLGLPGDVRVDKELPWTEVPRN